MFKAHHLPISLGVIVSAASKMQVAVLIVAEREDRCSVQDLPTGQSSLVLIEKVAGKTINGPAYPVAERPQRAKSRHFASTHWTPLYCLPSGTANASFPMNAKSASPRADANAITAIRLEYRLSKSLKFG